MLIVLVCLAAIFIYPFAVLRPILRLFREHPKPNTKSRFSMTDLLALMFVFQFPVVFANLLGAMGSSDAIPFVTVLMVVSVFVWLAGVMAANHLGVSNQWKRIVIIGITFPMAIVGAFTIPVGFVGFFRLMNGELLSVVGGLFPFCFFLGTLAIYRSGVWAIEDCALKSARDERAAE